MSALPEHAPALGEELLPRAQPSLDESFSFGLGLGIVVNKDGQKVSGSDLGARRVIDRPASEILAGSNPFQRTEPMPQRASAMPSSATVDRLVINDVLEQYKPGDNSMVDTSFPAPATTMSPPMSFLGPPTWNVGSLPMHDEPSLTGFLVQDKAVSSDAKLAAPATSMAPQNAPAPSVEPIRDEEMVKPTSAPPASSPVRPSTVPKIVSHPQNASPVRHSSPKRAMPPEIGDLADPDALPSPERLRQAREASPDRLHEAPVGQVADDLLDVDALLADEPGADESMPVNVDDLLQEDALDADGPGMARSTTMRRIHTEQKDKTHASVTAAAPSNVDLPTLPSWSPIVWDGLLPDVEPRMQAPRAVELPARTVRPRISRDAIRARVEQKKSHILNEIPPERRQPASTVRPPPRGPVTEFASGPLLSRPGVPQLHSPLAHVENVLQDHASRTVPGTSEPTPPMSEELERQTQWFGNEVPAASAAKQAAAASPTEEPHEDSDQDEFVSPLSRVSTLPEETQKAPTESDDPVHSTAFRHLMERELTRIVRESDKRYKVRERDVYVGTRPTDRGFGSKPAPWKRVQQPNEVSALAQGTRAATPRLDARGATTHGRLFLALDTFTPSGLTVPLHATFYCVLDNNIHRVKTPSVPLVSGHGASAIHQEFELVESAHFALTLSLLLDADAEDVTDAEVAEMGHLSTDARTGMSRFLSRHLGSKGVRDPRRVKPPAPTRVGAIGSARLVLADILSDCFARCATLDLPVYMDAEPRTLRRHMTPKVRGTLRARVFYLPPLPDAMQEGLPGNMEEAVQGMSSVAWRDTATSYEGILTQLGGDCASWRRRPMRIVGLNLVCYNEVTKRPVTRIDLVQALSVDERPPAAEGRDTDEVCQVPRSFCLTFRDGERIYLYADSDEEKVEWMHTLHNIIAHKLTPPPAWAMAAASAYKARFGSQRPTSSFSRPGPTASRPTSPLPPPPSSGPSSAASREPAPTPPAPEAPPPPTLSSRVTPAMPKQRGPTSPHGRAPPRAPKVSTQAPSPQTQPAARPPTVSSPTSPVVPRTSSQLPRPVDPTSEAANDPVHGAKRAAQRVRHMASRWLGKRS